MIMSVTLLLYSSIHKQLAYTLHVYTVYMESFNTAFNLMMRKTCEMKNLYNFVHMYTYNVYYKLYIIMLDFSRGVNFYYQS